MYWEREHTSSPQLAKFDRETINKFLNNIPITSQEIKIMISPALGPESLKLHPESLGTIPDAKKLYAGIYPDTLVQQYPILEA